MTDEQIVKGLECCIKSDHFGECFANKCPMIMGDKLANVLELDKMFK